MSQPKYQGFRRKESSQKNKFKSIEGKSGVMKSPYLKQMKIVDPQVLKTSKITLNDSKGIIE